jgi:hypothetical protein
MAHAHKEVPVKVTAWIDEGIVPLVEALNACPDVLTVDSCEGDEAGGAYVLFRVRGSCARATTFAESLASDLSTAPEAAYVLQAEWRPGEDEPLLVLSCPPDQVALLASRISSCRTTPSGGGTASTAPRSSTARHHRQLTAR